MLKSTSVLGSLSVTDISAIQRFFYQQVDFPVDKSRFAFCLQNWNLRYVSKNHWLCSLWQNTWCSKTLLKLVVKSRIECEHYSDQEPWNWLRICSWMTARWENWEYRPCPQKLDLQTTWQKLDKYTFAINVHFPAKSYTFWIHTVKFNKVEGNMVFPERSKESSTNFRGSKMQ